ncbi:MAG: hypothetical protein VKM01_05320 [Cyanobacteriota bacterium]|nr:hypothetical protein [Cyanobacteriota bacterium]
MTRCWFHIGMPKTGSSSIQETLYYELRDPGFIYCGFGEINSSFALSSFVGQATHIGAIRQLGKGRLAGLYHQRMLGRFQRSLARARSGDAALILSAELAYGWRRDQHLWWRQFASEHCLDLRIVVYLRPPIDWLASALSEGLKFGRQSTHAGLVEFYLHQLPERHLDLCARIDMLVDVYGKEAVVIRPFLRSALLEGCVVRDFCRVVGLGQAPATIHRQNDSLSLEASQCLHLRNIAMGRPLRGTLDLLRRDALLQQLGRIFPDRPSLRLEPGVLGDGVGRLERQLAALQQRHGLALPLSTAASGGGLASLDPLLTLPVDAQDRLAAAVAAGGGTPAEALARLERGRAAAPLLRSARRLLRRELRHARVGC